MNKPKNPISLYAEATPNPNVMKFTANKILIDESNYEFNNRAEASNFPLVALNNNACPSVFEGPRLTFYLKTKTGNSNRISIWKS